MLTSEQQKPKRSKIRYAEYYDKQTVFDGLYADSQKGKVFCNLVNLMENAENIKLAYRTIKGNTGSETAGVDGRTIQDIRDEDGVGKKERSRLLTAPTFL